jgi:hypothetical protein
VRGEEKCLPCYQGCDGIAVEKDSYCSVCYTEPLGQAPTVRLQCGHAFHYSCVKHILTNRWNGPRMNFGFMGCPLCKVGVSASPIVFASSRTNQVLADLLIAASHGSRDFETSHGSTP